MKLLAIGAFLFTTLVYAKDVSIKVDPQRPVYNESYEVVFKVKLEGDEQPKISFTPINIEVINRSIGGTQTQASFINGRASISKTVTYIYEVVSKRFGNAYLKDIKIDLGDRVVKHPSVRITILERAKETKNIFVRAEPDKEEAFVGEAILVRYYLYNRADIPITSTDVRKFPKLDKFLKRFHQEQMVPERVRVNNQMYVRRVMYTAQVFGEKPGDYTIDPISLRIGYSNRRNAFNNFGFNLQMGSRKKTTASSERINITVKPLPGIDIPKDYTGLVGEHNFKIKVNKEKFIVNEPIEIQLVVDGNGALELFDPPSVLNFPEVEEFDKKTDLTIKKDFTALKKVDFTYLARGGLSLKDHSVSFSYFDPVEMKFKTKTLNLGNITISGAKMARQDSKKDQKVQGQPEVLKTPPVVKDKPLKVDPFLKPVNTVLYNARELAYAFSAILVLLLVFFGREVFKYLARSRQKNVTFERVYKEGLNYKDFIHIMELVGISGDIRTKIKETKLGDKSRAYFIELLDSLNDLYEKQSNEKLKIKKKYFRELENLIKEKNEITYEL